VPKGDQGHAGHDETHQMHVPDRIHRARLGAHDHKHPQNQPANNQPSFDDVVLRHSSPFNLANAFEKPIVTQVEIAKEFYLAETYHQDYFRRNPNAPYCRLVIAPKLKKTEIRPELLK
jgi:hypothetical protein